MGNTEKNMRDSMLDKNEMEEQNSTKEFKDNYHSIINEMSTNELFREDKTLQNELLMPPIRHGHTQNLSNRKHSVDLKRN